MTFATRIQQKIYISTALVFTTSLLHGVPAGAQTEASPLLIYQVQTGTAASANQEYITVYNNTNEPADVTDWCVLYASASDVTQTQLGCLRPPAVATKLLLAPYSSLLLATSDMVQAHPGFTPDIVFSSGIAASSGHIKLVDKSKRVADIVGWGAAVHPEGAPVSTAATNKILQRQNTAEILKDTNNNAADFYQTELTILPGGNISETLVPVAEMPMPVLSEILPDATGSDAGKEFIELYNPSGQPIDLALYSVALGPAFSKLYPLPNMILGPESYISFSDIETGLTLPNTSAVLRLLGPNDKVAGEVTYAELEEGTALIYMNGGWQQTYQPTPGGENQLVPIKPCPEGQVRNVETRQCKTLTLAGSVLECRAGQLRNPETGRCKNITMASTAAAACKVGQEKNPATNRCRNIASTEPAKPCPAGQERNSETGRCKKITALASSGTNSVKDVPSALVANNIKWWIAGVAGAGVIAYGLYEWRHEVFSFTLNLKNKLLPG